MITFPIFGAFCFGLVIGWIVYRTLRRKEGASALSDVSTVIGAVGGGAIMAIFKAPELFAGYSIGLAAGFFIYFVLYLVIYGKDPVSKIMGD